MVFFLKNFVKNAGSVSGGVFTAIVGPNACGTSTLLRPLAQLTAVRHPSVAVLHRLNLAFRHAGHLVAMHLGAVSAADARPPATAQPRIQGTF